MAAPAPRPLTAMLGWFKRNRLKVFSFCAVVGDLLTGLGGASIDAGRLLMAGSALALTGHAILLFWGRGGHDARIARIGGRLAPVWMRPLIPWHYPLDAGFAVFVVASACYAIWGWLTPNWPMFMVGALLGTASLIGWLVPQDRRILGLRAVQLTAAMYIMASVNTVLAGIVAGNPYILASACIYICGNTTLFFTRKEDQSTYTQEHGA